MEMLRIFNMYKQTNMPKDSVGLNYFKVYPCTPSEAQDYEVRTSHISYDDPDQSFANLMKKYLEESGINKEARNVGFCLARGTKIMPNFTIRDLRHHLRILSLDEVYLYLNYDTPYFHGRNALLSPNFEKEKDYGTYQLFGLHVKIDGIQHSKAEFYLPLKRDDGYFIFLMKLMKKIEVKYKFRCRQEDIEEVFNESTGKRLDKKISITDQKKLYDNSTIVVKLKRIGELKIPASSQKHLLTVFDKISQKQVKVNFQEIRQMTCMAFYCKYFSQFKAHKIYLRFQDPIEVVTPLQSMSVLSYLFSEDTQAEQQLYGWTEMKDAKLEQSCICANSKYDVEVEFVQRGGVVEKCRQPVEETHNNSEEMQLKKEAEKMGEFPVNIKSNDPQKNKNNDPEEEQRSNSEEKQPYNPTMEGPQDTNCQVY